MAISYRGRNKSTNNPEGLCRICNVKIFNKPRHSVYCIEHAEMTHIIQMKVSNTFIVLKQQYPNCKIKYKLMVEIKCRKKRY